MAVSDHYGVGESTLRHVLVSILTSPEPPSRKQVAERLALSSATITKAVSYLIERGYILQEPEKEAGRPGRREAPLRINSERCYIVGISIRDTGELVGVITDLSAEVVDSSLGVFDGSTPDQLVAAVRELVQDLIKPYGTSTRGIGVALGGHIDSHAGEVRHSWNFSTPWEDVRLAKRLYEATNLEVQIENDANALALYEQWFGCGRDRDNFVVARATTEGVGFGIVAHRELLHGEDGLNGELGHAEIDPTGTTCRCGSRGCLETFIKSAVNAVRIDDKSPNTTKLVAKAGEAMGRVLAQLQLTNASSRLIICGQDLVHLPEFQAALYAAFERRPFVSSPRRIIDWHTVTEEEVARGAASMMLRHLDLR